MSPAKKAVKISTGAQDALADKLALRWYAVPGVLSGILALTWFVSLGLKSLPITGADSIGRATILLGTFTGLISFAIAYVHQARQEGIKRQAIFVRDAITLTFAHGVLLFGVLALLTFTFNAAFKELRLDIYTSAILIGTFTAIANYVMILLGLTVRTMSLIVVLSTILVGGVILTAVTNSNPLWWQTHFSYLGMASSSNARAFNLTLITASLVMLSLTEYIFTHLSVSQEEVPGLRYLKWLFVGAALGLGGVGLFPYTADTIYATLHNGSAMSMVLFILAMIAGLRWFVPNIQNEFLATSYAIAGALVACYILFMFTGYLTLTAFELAAFGLSFAWLILLLRNLQLWSNMEVHTKEGGKA